MPAASVDELKSPVKKLVAFFRRSRDDWKTKYFEKRDKAILLANQVRAVEKSREQWRMKAEAAEQRAKELEALLKKRAQRRDSST
jgi:hypothetical protein